MEVLRFVLILCCLATSATLAEVVRIDVETRDEIAEGKSYGLVGSYERLVGRMYFEVDPALDQNRIIKDIEFAPRNPAGKVEFSADFYLIKPKNIESGNGALFFDVVNRGRKAMLVFNRAPFGIAAPVSEADMGDGFLLRHGFSLLWVGWQFDVDGDDLMRVYAPIAMGDGQPIEGLARSDFRVSESTRYRSLGDRGHKAYPVSDPSDARNVLTVRDAPTGERQIIARSRWQFAREESGRVVRDLSSVYLETGFEPGRIYELVYVAQNPPIAGAGLAAIRDAVSQLKYEGAAELSIPADALNRSIAHGGSQSGRLLRTFLYDGFNEDEQGRKVFDGVNPFIAGGKRGSFNHRFAQPSRGSGSYFYPPNIFPSHDVSLTDPATGKADGLLANIKPSIMPKIVHANSSTEYWRSSGALTHTTVDGTEDVAATENVRIYHFSGTRHSSGPPFPPRALRGGYLDNPNASIWFLRALLLALDRWIVDEVPPPASRYPMIGEGTLVDLASLRFPQIGPIRAPQTVRRDYVVNHGPRFSNYGIASKEPPEVGTVYPFLVPAVDEDGNEIGGLRSPSISVPLGTYTGWIPGEPEAGLGLFLPFARTEAERHAAGDPRLSIEERYSNVDEYLGLVTKETLALVDDGYLLPEDVGAVRQRARDVWDYVMSNDDIHTLAH